MQELNGLLRELIVWHECVVVPGFGAFVTNSVAAHFEESDQRFYPASRHITLNIHLKHNDGLLVGKYAEKHGLEMHEALKQVERQIAGWHRVLDQEGHMELEGLGNVFIVDGELQFQEIADQDMFPADFGLRAFHWPVQETFQVVRDEEEVVEEVPEKKRKPFYWAAAAAIFLAVFYSAWIPTQTDLFSSGELQWSDLNLFRAMTCPSYAPRQVEPLFYVNEGETAGPKMMELFAEENAGNLEVKEEKKVKLYHIIGGVFTKEKHANRMVRRMKRKGYDSSIMKIEGSNRMRVSIAGYYTKEEALRRLKKVRRSYNKGAWVLTLDD